MKAEKKNRKRDYGVDIVVKPFDAYKSPAQQLTMGDGFVQNYMSVLDNTEGVIM